MKHSISRPTLCVLAAAVLLAACWLAPQPLRAAPATVPPTAPSQSADATASDDSVDAKALADPAQALALAPEPRPDPELQAALTRMVRETLAEERGGLEESQIHIALLDLRDKAHPSSAHFRGDISVYPASVIKMYYMAYVYHLAEQGELTLTPAIEDLLLQMIRPSSNVATGKIVDLWSGVRHDALMDDQKFQEFAQKRNACNRWLQGPLAIEDVNANQKTWGGTIPHGERQFLSDGAFGGPWTNRNAMTALAAARFLQLLAQDKLATPESCQAMRRLMARDVNQQAYQKRRIAGGAPPGASVYSKTGTTSDTFHDAGIIVLPTGETFALVTLLTGKGVPRQAGTFIPRLTRKVSEHMAAAP